jgi:hypothetical protein
VRGTDEATVRLGRPRRSVKVYDPTLGTEAVREHADVESVPLTLSDHPVVLVIPRE